jgi:hypothetical protein
MTPRPCRCCQRLTPAAIWAMLPVLFLLSCSHGTGRHAVDLTGNLQDTDLGCWALVTDDGASYELKDLPVDFEHDGLRVIVHGTERPELLTICMIGTVVEVNTIAGLDPEQDETACLP